MGAMSIRNVDDELMARLRVQAARHGRSMEAEVRSILAGGLEETRPADFMGEVRRRFGALGGVDLDIPPRSSGHRRVDLPT